MIGIRELARHLDISIGTVSRALNGKADVNLETRKRVQAAAAALGYSPNQSGRSLRKGATGLVGVLIPSDPEQTLVDPVFAAVLDGLHRCLPAAGLDLAIFLYSGEEEAFAALRRVAERRMADALIIAQTQRVDPRIDFLLARAIPFVAFGRSGTGAAHSWVDMDFGAAVDGAVERLVGLGHRRIAAVLPDGDLNYAHLMIERLREALVRHGIELPATYLPRLGHGEAGGYRAGEALLALDERPTAVLAAGRTLAVGLYDRLREAGVRPGRDLAVIGLHCDAQAQFLSPSLSCFQSDLPRVGRELGGALLAAMGRAGDGVRLVQCLVPVTFRQGDSEGGGTERAGAS